MTFASPLSRSRAVCAVCMRPVAACICFCVTPLNVETEVLILQHTEEIHQAKGSARLLHLCLPGSALMQGESFDEHALSAALYQLHPARTDSKRKIRPVLLYPSTSQSEAGELQIRDAPEFVPDTDPDVVTRLVILDATWRKSRKMLYKNPLLQQLPRLSLNLPQASQYRIRKAHQPGQLSSLEACAYALMQLEHDPAQLYSLLQSFDRFIDFQLDMQQRGRVGPT